MARKSQITLNKMLDRFVFCPEGQLVYDRENPANNPLKLADLKAACKGLTELNPNPGQGRKAEVDRVDVWLAHVDREEVVSETFIPGGEVIVDNKFNRWVCPWSVHFKLKRWDALFNALLDHVFPSPEAREYANQFFGQMFQEPANVPSVCLVSVAACKGTGRGTLVECLKPALDGYLCAVQSVDTLAKYNHNDWMYARLLVVVNEIAAPNRLGDNATVSNQLKTWIADHHTMINPKGRPMFPADLFFRMFIATNSNHGVTIEHGDRRFGVFHGNDNPIDVKLAARLHEAKKHPDFARYVAYYFMSVQLKTNYLFVPPPMTIAKRSMMHLSTSEEVAMYMDIISEVETDLATRSYIEDICLEGTDTENLRGFRKNIRNALDSLGAVPDQAAVAKTGVKKMRYWILRRPQFWQKHGITPQKRWENMTFTRNEKTRNKNQDTKTPKVVPISRELR